MKYVFNRYIRSELGGNDSLRQNYGRSNVFLDILGVLYSVQIRCSKEYREGKNRVCIRNHYKESPNEPNNYKTHLIFPRFEKSPNLFEKFIT